MSKVTGVKGLRSCAVTEITFSFTVRSIEEFVPRQPAVLAGFSGKMTFARMLSISAVQPEPKTLRLSCFISVATGTLIL